MRLKLYEDAIRSRKKTDSVKSDATGTDEATSSDQSDSIFHTVDVGREAGGNWAPNGSRKVLQDRP